MYEVALTFAEHHIRYPRPIYHVSVYRTKIAVKHKIGGKYVLFKDTTR